MSLSKGLLVGSPGAFAAALLIWFRLRAVYDDHDKPSPLWVQAVPLGGLLATLVLIVVGVAIR